MIKLNITSEESIQQNLDTWCFEVGSKFEEIGKDAASNFYTHWLRHNNYTLFPYTIESGHVVDLGSGDGASSEQLKSLGFNVVAVDINKEKLDKIKERTATVTTVNKNILEYLNTIEFLPNIFTHHSLEHTIDAEEIIELCAVKLKEGGIYYAIVPAEDYLHSVHHIVFESPDELLPPGLTPLLLGTQTRFGEKEYICVATKD